MEVGLDVSSVSDVYNNPPPPLITQNVANNPPVTAPVINATFVNANRTGNSYNPSLFGNDFRLTRQGTVALNNFIANLRASLLPVTVQQGNLITTTTSQLTNLTIGIATGFGVNTSKLGPLNAGRGRTM